MASEASPAFTQNASNIKATSHRVFKDRPSVVYIDDFAQHIRDTGSPETYPGLYQNKISREAKFRRLRAFSIDRKKRHEMGKAFCPRCGQVDKFIHGTLAWFPDLQICAAIGNCCASHEAGAEADREFRERQKVNYEESYLLAALPLLKERLAIARGLREGCQETLKIYRQFRKEATPLQTALRRLKDQYSGHLVVTSVIGGASEEPDDGREGYEGPAGFRGKGRYQVETRDTDLGLMGGLVALQKDFNPQKDLDTIERQLASFDSIPEGEGAAIDFIVSMSAAQRTAAVAILLAADRNFGRLVEHLDDFWSFFSSENLAAIQRYSEHPDSLIHIEVERQEWRGRTTIRLQNRSFYCRLSYANPEVFKHVSWPNFAPIKKDSLNGP